MLVSTETLHLEYLDGKTISVITLDDPAHANAMSPEMGDAFSRAVRDVQNEADVRAVVIRGAGKDFSIGGHRDMLIRLGSGSMTEGQLHDFMLAFYDRWLPMLDLAVPVISALQGDCIGVAPVFACAPDIAVADETLNLQVTFAGLALYPGMGLPWLQVGRKPRSAAHDVQSRCLGPGSRAPRTGGAVCSSRTAFDEALRVAGDIAASGPETVRLLKKNLGLQRGELQAELEGNASQQARDFRTAEYRARIAHYLPNHYD